MKRNLYNLGVNCVLAGLVLVSAVASVPAEDAQTEKSSKTAGKKLRVAVFKDRRAVAVDEIVRALEEAGMDAEPLESKEFDRICEFDAIFFGGGWNAFNWLHFDDRVRLVDYVEEKGGGAIFSMFRCGTACRGLIRPIFPNIAYAYTKSNGSDMFIRKPGHPVTRGLPQQFITPYWDHAVLDVGVEGDVLAVDSNDDPMLVCGRSGKGRVVFIGPWIGLHDQYTMAKYPLLETDGILLLNVLNWVTDVPERHADGDREVSKRALTKVLRREKILDWTCDRGEVSSYMGIIPRAMYPSAQKLESLVFRLDRLEPCLNTVEQARGLVDLRKRIAVFREELDAAYRQAVEKKKRELKAMSSKELQEEKVWDFSGWGKDRDIIQKHVDEWRESLFPAYMLEHLDAQVAQLEQQLDLSAYRELELKNERVADKKGSSEYVALARSENVRERRRGVEELARIGGAEAEKVLLAALEDPGEQVRITAVKGLAWMQSRNAVEPLVSMVKNGNDTWMRRRAVQALGQIGDDRAFNTLINAIDDDDVFVRRNAILSLGLLGNRDAVPHLLKILDNPFSKEEPGEDGKKALVCHAYVNTEDLPYSSTDIACAVRALGHLGDKTSLPVVENFFESYKITSGAIPQEYLLEKFRSEIGVGGRSEKGIAQKDAFANKGNYYPFRSRYSGLFGRWVCFRGRPVDVHQWADYASGIGGAGNINFVNTFDLILPRKNMRFAWEKNRDNRERSIYDARDYFDRLDFKQYFEIPNTGHMVFDLAGLEQSLMTWGQHPHFAGFWQEESFHYCSVLHLTDADKEFRAYLEHKYSRSQLKELGIDDLAEVKIPEADGKGRRYLFEGSRSDKVVFAEYVEFLSDRGIEYWREGADWIRQFRKGARLTYSLSQRYQKGAGLIDAYALAGKLVFDCYGPQCYCAHSMFNNFDNDMHVDGESRPSMGEFYAHQSTGPDRIERGLASSFVHGQCFFNHQWRQIFKYPPDSNVPGSTWDKGRWAAFARQYRKGKAISEYLAPRDTESVGLVAQIYSGRSSSLTYGRGAIDSFGGFTSGGRRFRYTQNQEGVWEALMQSHLPVDMTWMETQTPDKLKRYKVVVLGDAWSLTDEEAELLRGWVRRGGVLVATAGSSLHDRYDRARDDYALADVFGVKHLDTRVQGGLKDMYLYIERAIKPDKGIVEIKIEDADLIKHAEGVTAVEYEKNIGFDIIEPTTARVLATWDDGIPAVTENRFGKGACIFLSPMYPGLSCRTMGWTVNPLYNEYWQGARELLAACVRRGLEITDTDLPLKAKNCPLTVEAVLKKQPYHDRWIAHFLDIDPDRERVAGIEVAITVPEGRQVKSVYCPYPARAEVDFEVVDGKVEFPLRPFSAHELVVVEWE